MKEQAGAAAAAAAAAVAAAGLTAVAIYKTAAQSCDHETKGEGAMACMEVMSRSERWGVASF
jgi:hypothetical protein